MTDEFFALLNDGKDNEALEGVFGTKDNTPEIFGLKGYCYYYGVGDCPENDDAAYAYFEAGAYSQDSLSLYCLGIMCDEGRTPDQAEGGPRQRHDQFDAEDFMTRCECAHGTFESAACLWLGEYFMDSTRGEDPEVGVEYYERAAAAGIQEAVKALAEYYWEMAGYREYKDPEYNEKLFHWQQLAYEGNPHDESYNYGCLLDGSFPGIPENLRLCLKLYEEDYEFGHSQGARALARHYEALSTDPRLSDEVALKAAKTAEIWDERADKNAENDYEPEQIIEED